MGRSRNAATADLADAAETFAALGDRTRLSLVAHLCQRGPQSITSLTGEVPISRQAVTKHLEALSHAGLVHSAWEGRERIWRIEPARLADARRHLETISREWDRTVTRLRAFVESDEE